MHQLVMPETLAGPCIERNETVREQIVANAIAAEEIESRRAEGNKCDPVLLVDRELAPGVNAAGFLVRTLWPRVVAELTRMRNAVEDPRDLAGDDVIGLHVGGGRIVSGALCRQRDDEQMLEYLSGVAGLERVARLTPQRDAQIHTAVVPERGDRLAGLRADRCQIPGIQIQEPTVLTILAFPI